MSLFDRAAPLFAVTLDRRWRPEDVTRIAGLLRPFVPVGGRLLDVGGGTGGLAVRLLPLLDASVTILDPSAAMMRRVPRRRALVTVQGTAESMPFPGDTFDAVVVSDAFHHFRDLTTSVSEMVRVTRPGGGVLILEIDPSGWRRPLVWAERLVGEPGHFFRKDDFCAFMAAHKAPGDCVKHGLLGYYYVGTVTA
jgi:demethylmenaquinone methyltransferase/2-methoxy-6-polyprenyl-1,4-benzoquinol methylase